MLVTVNNNTFSPWKTLVTFSKIPAMGWDMYKIEFTSWKIFITVICMPAYFHHYYFLWSKWHAMFSQIKFQIGINSSHVTFLRCVWIKPHSSSLTNVKISTSSFCQSFQICCREDQKEGKNGNCKAFCVIRKRNKIKQHYGINICRS